jgi:cytochrome b6-f complex iron-sulfur subunit
MPTPIGTRSRWRRRRRHLELITDALLSGEALPSGRLVAGDLEAARTAIALRAARPGAEHPDEAFVTELRHRIAIEATPPAGIPRRALLAAAAGAAGAVGAVAAGFVGAVAETAVTSGTGRVVATGTLVPDDGTWVQVASAADVLDGEVQRFATPTTVGFVMNRGGQLDAVSGSCTHQGCLLKLNTESARFDCPCHLTSFGLDGKLLFYQLASAPAPLPHIPVRNRDGQVEAFLPKTV